MPIGPLLTVFGFLLGRATTVSTSDILLFLGLGLHFIFLFARTTTTSEVNAVLQYLLEITLLTHSFIFLQRTTADKHGQSVKVCCRPLLIY